MIPAWRFFLLPAVGPNTLFVTAAAVIQNPYRCFPTKRFPANSINPNVYSETLHRLTLWTAAMLESTELPLRSSHDLLITKSHDKINRFNCFGSSVDAHHGLSITFVRHVGRNTVYCIYIFQFKYSSDPAHSLVRLQSVIINERGAGGRVGPSWALHTVEVDQSVPPC